MTVAASTENELGRALDDLERDGYAILPGALSRDETDRVARVVDALYAAAAARGALAGDGSMHLLEPLRTTPALAPLATHPGVLALVASALGWNIHVYHSHADVHPPLRAVPPPAWRWHQDGGRQNLELETDPRPRLSLKAAYFLSDASAPGRGNLLVIPGSHRCNRLARPAADAAIHHPAGAVPVLAAPGTACVFDRRLWHSRSDNTSAVVRKVVFAAYTYRWIRPRDDGPGACGPGASPLERQLLGGAGGHWLPADADVPLRAWMSERGLLDAANPTHR